MSARCDCCRTLCSNLFCLLFSARIARQDTFPSRFAGKCRFRTGTYRVRTAYWRGNTMDKLAFQRYADLSNLACVQFYRWTFDSHVGISPLVARLCLVPICLSLGLLYPASCVQFPPVVGCIGQYFVGILFLFPYYYRCRTPLEGNGIGLSSADDSRRGAGLSGQIPVGLHRYSGVHSL